MSSKKGGPPSDKPLYPTQASAQAYPSQPPPYGYGAPMMAGGPPMVHGAPPPYAPQAPYGAPMYGQPCGQPYGQAYMQPYGVPQTQPYYPTQTVVVQGGFDAGARFDGNSKPNVPPPPPGCLPNAAQMAGAQGANLVVTQRRGNFWEGGSDGGYTMF